uniref:ComEC/Rec2 family competence protein n=1 Tax=uncultured Amnibacterium sp. TaxID=1631851 RepID=UPI0035CCA047
MSDRLVRTGLLLPAAGAWVVALTATAQPVVAVPGAVVALAAAAVLVPRAVRRRTRAAVLLACGALVLVAVLAAVAVGEARRHPSGIPTDRPVLVHLRVDTVLRTTAAGVSGALGSREVVRGTVVELDGRPVSVPVTVFGDRLHAVPGAVVRLRVALRRAEPTDAAAYLGTVRGGTALRAPPPPEQQAAAALRAGLLARTAGLPGDGAALLPGLAVGDTSRVGEDLQQAMRDSSLTHLTAVSGANCAVVVITVLAIGGVLRLPRAARILLAGAALGGFVVLVTPQPSVVRAAVMAAVGLVCVLRGGRAAGVPALALALLVLLVADPWIAWSPGFVLSVAATAGLLLLAPPLAERLARVLPRRLALVLAVPVAAQAACQPVLAL